MKQRTRREVLGDIIAADNLTMGAEIGVGSGPTSLWLMQHFPDLLWLAVDHWPAGFPLWPAERGVMTAERQVVVRNSFMRVLDAFADRLTLIEKPSIEAAALVADGSLDIVFIDGDHSYAGCRVDIEVWTPKIRRRGWLAGHDYSERFPGVMQAVDELLPHRSLHADDVWMVRI